MVVTLGPVPGPAPGPIDWTAAVGPWPVQLRCGRPPTPPTPRRSATMQDTDAQGFGAAGSCAFMKLDQVVLADNAPDSEVVPAIS